MNLQATEPLAKVQSIGLSEPLFLFGIMTRSGTNFLYRVLEMHPDFQGVNSTDMPEDHLMTNAHLLQRYAANVASYWGRHGKQEQVDAGFHDKNQALKGKLLENIGYGLSRHLHAMNPTLGEKRTLTKTPNVRNLDVFFNVFPKAKAVILVRDGRAVIESNMKSFGSSFGHTLYRWEEAAQTIIDFDKAYKERSNQYLIIRYEDLIDDFRNQIINILNFAGLDSELFDFSQAENLPIFGSSENYSKPKKSYDHKRRTEIGWKVVEKSSNFDPKSRWSNWSRAQHSRFNWVASDSMAKLGYSIEDAQDSIAGKLKNKLLDAYWELIETFVQMTENVERFLYAVWLVKRQYRYLRME